MASRKKAVAVAAVESEEIAPVQAEPEAETKKLVPKDVDQNTIIPVINGFPGRLVYVSKRSGESFVWEQFGDEQDMELKELRNVKSAAKTFFINGWMTFSNEYAWVINYLGLEQYYKHALKPDEFEDIFQKSPSEVKRIVAQLSAGQKQSVAYMAREKVISGEIDSRKVIQAFEDSLGVELIER